MVASSHHKPPPGGVEAVTHGRPGLLGRPPPGLLLVVDLVLPAVLQHPQQLGGRFTIPDLCITQGIRRKDAGGKEEGMRLGERACVWGMTIWGK